MTAPTQNGELWMGHYCNKLDLGAAQSPRYVVVLSVYEGKYLLSRHKERSTWETQGGHIEPGETPLEAAKRELYEESGAVGFDIVPLFDYEAGDRIGSATGVVFCAHITELGCIPDSEMAEVQTFAALPQELTYPNITPHLFRWAEEMQAF